MTMHESKLYENLLGDAWPQLAGPVRAAHRSTSEARGVFSIKVGNNRLARLLARYSDLPKSGNEVETLLHIETLRGIEHWQRDFNGHVLTTRQWASKDGLLIESFNGWELGFVLAEEDGALIYRQCRAYLCFGTLRVRIPLALAPRVHAREHSVGRDTAVEVNVALPLIGTLIAYNGELRTQTRTNQ